VLRRGRADEPQVLEVNIEKGMQWGERIILRGEGEQEPGVEPGDCIIVSASLLAHTYYPNTHYSHHIFLLSLSVCVCVCVCMN
jgi:DnaJ-class molecular chaperone